MKISRNWLADHVDLDDVPPEVLAERLTLGTAEVEGFEIVANRADRAVVARILAVEEIAPDQRAVTVDAGSGRHTAITSTADVAEGMHVAFADVPCTPADLGLGSVSDVLVHCPPDAAVGTPLSEWIPARDVLIEIDNKSLTHRPDLWGHYGFARELAAILRRPLRELDLADLAAYATLPELSVINDGGRDCPCVTALAVDVDNAGPSPLRIQARLALLEQRSVNLLVDLSNYVMLELGQPTHAYDRDMVGELRVAPAGEVATFRTLDGQNRKLDPDDLLIWNDSEPVGLAGIMGGQASAISAATRRILLESANFRASRVRRTAVRLGLRTDASQRFEKAQPPAGTRTASARVLKLLEQSGAQPRVVSSFTVRGELREEIRTVELGAEHVLRAAGAPIPDAEIDAILTRLGFTVRRADHRVLVGVPPFRSEQDVAIPADVVEEVLRIYGYGSIEPRLPAAELTPVAPNPEIRREHKARRILGGAHGFLEVQTYLWTDDRWLARIGYDPGPGLRLRNPVAPEKARLRSTLLPNLLQLVNDNLDNREEFALFEVGRAILVAGDSHTEVARLAGVSVRPAKALSIEEHYRQVKGALEAVVGAIGVGKLRAEPDPVGYGEPPWRVPDVTARLLDDTGTVGTAGILLGPILDAVAPKRQAVWFELELDRLTGPLYPAPVYRPVPVYPDSQQDFSILWPTAETYASLERTLDEFHHPLVHRREFLLDYKGKGLEPGIGSYTFRYWLVHPERTLTGEDLEGFRAGLLGFLGERGLGIR